MNTLQRQMFLARQRQMQQQHYRRPITPPRARPMRRRARPWGLRGAEETLGATFGSPDMLYGIIPMAMVVGAGFWMALH